MYYKTDQHSSPGLIIIKLGVIMSTTPTRTPILVEFRCVGNFREFVKYNLSVTFCSVPLFVHMPGANTCELICTIDGSKRVKSGKDVPFGGLVKKFSPHFQCSPNSENFALRKQFFEQ